VVMEKGIIGTLGSSTPRRFLPPAACLAVVLVFSGCGPDRPQTIPISGTVTFDGGPPPAPGALYFTSDDPAEGFDRRPAVADFDAEGRFEVKSWEEGDGLVPGHYKITVECWEVAPMMGEGPPKSYVPEKYTSDRTTDLEIEVTADDAGREIELDVRGSRS